MRFSDQTISTVGPVCRLESGQDAIPVAALAASPGELALVRVLDRPTGAVDSVSLPFDFGSFRRDRSMCFAGRFAVSVENGGDDTFFRSERNKKPSVRQGCDRRIERFGYVALDAQRLGLSLRHRPRLATVGEDR